MKVLVHAGMQKTGSSAVQHYLKDHREALGEHGIVYPNLRHHNHWSLGLALASGNSFNYLQRRAGKRNEEWIVTRALKTVERTLKNGRDEDWMLLSHESLSGVPQADNLHTLLRTHVAEEDITVLAYVRSPLALFTSAVQQKLKSRGIDLPSPGRWLSGHIKRAGLLRDAFGDRAVFRVHDRRVLIGGDIIEDFRTFAAGQFGRELPAADTPYASNTSPSAPASALMLRYLLAKSGSGADDYIALRKALGRFDVGQDAPKLAAPEAWNAAIALPNAKGWNDVLDHVQLDPAAKAKLRLPDDAASAEFSVDDVHQWILSSLDPVYTAAFAEHCRSSEEAGDVSDRLSAWAAEAAAIVPVGRGV